MSTINQVRRCPADLAEERIGVVERGHHVQLGLPQDAGQTFSDQHAVLGDRYPHGIPLVNGAAAAGRGW